MNLRRIGLGLTACLAVLAAPAFAGNIDQGLQEALAASKPNDVISTIVYLNQQVDLKSLDTAITSARASAQLRHELVVRALQTTADTSQYRLFDYLQQLSDAGRVESFESFWIFNAFRVDTTPDVIQELANQPDVKTVYFNYPIHNIAPLNAQPDNGQRGQDTPEPSIVAIHVPEVWAMGIHGEGILVSTIDTGVDGTHPALHDRWRGLDPRYAGHPDWAFFDPITHWTTPQDSAYHGTHTMGTVCGGAPGDQIGVAPGAQWIHAAVIDRGGLIPTCTNAVLSFQWLVDPDGNPNTNWDIPQTCSNSWGIGDFSIPPWSTPCDNSFWSYIDACEAAGTVVLFSAGNEGTAGLRRPADRATDDYRNMAVAAVDGHDPNFPLASFSSQGPTNCTPNGSSFIKPNIAAPGVNVRSSEPGNTYGNLDGTSMASPHVNGVIALMRQACPDLTVNQIKQVIYDTAVDRGAAGKDNQYGWGVIDALAAVQMSISMCVTSEGKLTLDHDLYPCESASIITVRDIDLNLDPNALDTTTVTVASNSQPAGLILTLIESDPNSGRFVGTVTLSATGGAGILQVANGDTVTATYIDANNGQGGFNVPVIDTATVDCVAPVISNVHATNIQPHTATIAFTANELARGTVHYGLSCGNLNLTQTGDSFGTDATVNLTGLQDNTTYYYSVDAVDVAGNLTSDPNCYTFATPEVPDYFTELFASAWDLQNLTLHFAPNGSVDFYVACDETPISNLPTDPAGGTPLALTDDSYTTVTLTGGAHVLLYGTSYATFYVGSNGYITFTSGDTNLTPSLATHFTQPRISALMRDLNPSTGGQVSWKQLADRAVVTWLNVPCYSGCGANTFQIEMFFDGRLTISYLTVAATDGLAGLSHSTSVPSDFFMSDLSAEGSCGPRPPNASSANVVVPVNVASDVTLIAGDDGLPNPPGALTYRIVTLPTHGDLSDPGAGPITTVPYDLVNFGSHVTYLPDPGYYGADAFQFLADDGGVPPDGGPSNIATETLNVQFGPPVITTTALPNACLSHNYNFQMQASQGQPPLAWSIVATGSYVEADLGNNQFTATGTAQNWRNDDQSWPYTLPFTFPYYGVNRTTVNVCSNGFLDFTSGDTTYSNSDAGLIAAARIAPLWDDLLTNFNASDDIYIDATIPNQVTIRWLGVTYNGHIAVNFAVTLYADGRIQFHYGPGNTGLTPTIGISKGDGVDYVLSTYNNATALTNANSHEFSQTSPLPPNITLSAAGLLSGVPTVTGTFTPHIKVTDALNRSAEQTFTLVVDATCGLLGDVNCDGIVDFDDINPFVLALSDPIGYHNAYPNCDINNADCDGSGIVDFDDINPFVAILSGGK